MVALRKESVDRNKMQRFEDFVIHQVALRKESVDRNCRRCFRCACRKRSLSARRAWIEIRSKASIWLWLMVALRKESVDRNLCYRAIQCIPQRSLSARRAWIEIIVQPIGIVFSAWSLSARRAWIEISPIASVRAILRSLSARRAWIEISVRTGEKPDQGSRSPQGERG